MSVEEELHEHAEHAKEPFDKRVAITMAIIAALLAIVSVLGHVLTTEELLTQQKASDQWAYSQAKDIRRYDSEIAKDMLVALKGQDQLVERYKSNSDKYKKDHDDIQAQASELEAERDHKGAQALRLEISEVFMEVGIVFASLAILSKKPSVWYLSMLSALAGIVIAATTTMIA